MSEIKIGENESLEKALARFRKQCSRSGVIGEARQRRHYEKPSEKRKRKSEEARRKQKRNKR